MTYNQVSIPKLTIVKGFHYFLHYIEKRVITVKICLKLQLCTEHIKKYIQYVANKKQRYLWNQLI